MLKFMNKYILSNNNNEKEESHFIHDKMLEKYLREYM